MLRVLKDEWEFGIGHSILGRGEQCSITRENTWRNVCRTLGDVECAGEMRLESIHKPEKEGSPFGACWVPYSRQRSSQAGC